ncbi:MAG: AraC family transcriptional regulator [Clostridia bacterium]|nr:AraC family transcriptional regulator [Clostridia bacterium]
MDSYFETIKNNPQEVFVFNIENCNITLFANSVVPKGRHVMPYSHSFHALIFVEKGSLEAKLEDNTLVMEEGDSLIVAPNVNHIIRFQNSETKVFCIGFTFSKNVLTDGNNLYKRICGIIPSAGYRFQKKDKLHQSIKRVFESYIEKNKYNVSLSFHEYLVALIMSNKSVEINEKYDQTVSDSLMGRLHRINTLANVYCDNEISVDDIAKMLSLSTKQVNRIIKTHFNCTWSELLTQKRMTLARDLLENSDMTIEEISEYVGYDSTRGFYSAFTKYFGENPGTIRKKDE